MTLVALRMDDDLVAKIDKAAADQHLNRSSFIRGLLADAVGGKLMPKVALEPPVVAQEPVKPPKAPTTAKPAPKGSGKLTRCDRCPPNRVVGGVCMVCQQPTGKGK